MVRQVRDVVPGEGYVDLSVTAVAYWQMPAGRGLLTTESPEAQGLRRHGVHAAASVIDSWPPAPATLRLRFPATDVLRLTLLPGPPHATRTDPDLGVLVDPQPGDGNFHFAEVETGLDSAGRCLVAYTSGVRVEIDRYPFRIRVFRHLQNSSQPMDGVARPTNTGGDEGAGDAGVRPILLDAGDIRQAIGAPIAPALAFSTERPLPAGTLGDVQRVFAAFELAVGDDIAGLGEQAGPPLRNGQLLRVAVDDAMGIETGRTYKAAPVLHSRGGYSLLIHTGGTLLADVGATAPGVLALEVDDDRLDLFVIVSRTLKERLERYTQLTGRPAVPPRWAFGVWMSRSRYRNRNELMTAARGMRERGVPCDVVHLDPAWLRRDVLNCDFDWSTESFGDPADLVGELASLGLHLSLWELPYLDPRSPLADKARTEGFLVTRAGGEPAEVAGTTSRDGQPRWLVDVFNPRARNWWAALHSPLLDAGVALCTTDFGEGLPDDASLHDGTTGRRARNLYPLWYNRCVYETIAARAKHPPLVLGRSGWAGSQRYPAQWGGDAESTVAGMAATLRAGLAWSLSAPGLWTHDAGGFYGGSADRPSPALYVRWAQFACLSPLARFHGLGPREPWEFGERALGIVGEFARLRYRLLPVIVGAAWEATRSGLPMLRPLCVEFENDPTCWQIAHEYLLGRDLLVAPVLDDSADPVLVKVYLPAGEWVDFFTGRRHLGPSHVDVTVGLETIPLFVRAGATLPFGALGQCTNEIPDGDWELHHWEGPPVTTTIQVPEGVAAYAAVGAARVTAIAASEPVRRAVRALCHDRNGGVRAVPLLR